MSAIAHNPKFAARAHVPQSVGKEFTAADKAQRIGKILAGKVS